MVTNKNLIFQIITLCLSAICLSSCEDEMKEPEKNTSGFYTYEMVLTDPYATKSSDSYEFSVYDKLYLQFTDELDNMWFSGRAIYYFFEGKYYWSVDTPYAVPDGHHGVCNIVFFKSGFNDIEENHYSSSSLDSTSEYYDAIEARWSKENGKISITAHLSSKQVRIQLVADSEKTVMIKGVHAQYSYNLRDGKQFFHLADNRYAPCYPQTIVVDKEREDGKFISDYYYCAEIGSDYCQHKVSDTETEPCSLDGYFYIYDRSDITKCYRRKYEGGIEPGSTLVINVPSQESHEGWEMINNRIRSINDGTMAGAIMPDTKDTNGFSVNFKVKKAFWTTSCLRVTVFEQIVFRMYRQTNGLWENYSAICHALKKTHTIAIGGKGTDYDESPWNHYDDVTYSHFPYYDQLIENEEDYVY